MAVLTKAQLALCAAMFGAGMVAPPVVKKVRAVYSKPAPSKPKVSVPVPPIREPVVIAPEPVPCIPSVQGSDGSIIAASPTQFGAPYILTPPTNVVIPGGGSGGVHPVVPGIPEPDTWAMLVLGFGFLGLSLRRKRHDCGRVSCD